MLSFGEDVVSDEARDNCVLYGKEGPNLSVYLGRRRIVRGVFLIPYCGLLNDVFNIVVAV